MTNPDNSNSPVNSVRREFLGIEVEAHPIVFPISAILLLIFVVLTASYPNRALMFFNALQGSISQHFAWLYIGAMSGFLIFALYLGLSRYGRIRLGPDDSKPDYGRLTWFSMLFSAGMGIGMLFFGVAEPMWHYLAPPLGEGETVEAAQQAMGITLFHWCLHPWALYALVALSLAYFGFRRNLPLSFRSVFYPIIGDRIHGRLGDFIDILAVLATLFGLATSLGLGAKQVNAGLNYVFGLPQSTIVQVVLIAVITAMAVLSLISGLDVGIRRLSEINMGLAGFLLLFLFVAGPTLYLMNALVENIGIYLQELPKHSMWTATYEGDAQASWFSGWTVFYWAWWIAWSPFVGMFIARISRGRTIREFIFGVLLVPSAVAVIWMTGFGNSALHQEVYHHLAGDPDAVEEKFDYDPIALQVKTTDEVTGLGITPDGAYLIGADAKGVAHPKPILMQADGNGNLTTADGVAVEYVRGVLVHKDNGRVYHPDEESLYDGAYMATEQELSLGDYLTEPVLNGSATQQADTTATAMFFMLKAYPFAKATSLIATLSVILFFVTSSDSASLVADIIASGGSEDPTLGTRLFWGILEGCLAAALLLAGGLVALQTGSITIGLPFCIIIILMCVSLAIGLRRDYRGELTADQLATVQASDLRALEEERPEVP